LGPCSLRPVNRISDLATGSLTAPYTGPVPTTRSVGRPWKPTVGCKRRRSVGTRRERFSWVSSSTLIRLDLSPRSKAKLLNLALHWQINDDALSVDTHYTDM
jgi:hypothetical protein